MSEYNQPLIVPPHTREKSAQVISIPQHNTIFIFPPKCAQTSLRRWVGSDVVSPTYYRNVGGNEAIVMSVRNPFDRLVSAWANKYDNRAFGAFVTNVCSHTDEALDIHVQSQGYLLERCGRRQHGTPDYFLRVGESLYSDISALKRQLTWLRGSPEHANKSAHESGLAMFSKDRELYEMVRARYRDDFELWEMANEVNHPDFTPGY